MRRSHGTLFILLAVTGLEFCYIPSLHRVTQKTGKNVTEVSSKNIIKQKRVTVGGGGVVDRRRDCLVFEIEVGLWKSGGASKFAFLQV